MLLRLTDLPLEHFELREAPDSASQNPQHLYASATHRMAIEKMRYAIAAKGAQRSALAKESKVR